MIHPLQYIFERHSLAPQVAPRSLSDQMIKAGSWLRPCSGDHCQLARETQAGDAGSWVMVHLCELYYFILLWLPFLTMPAGMRRIRLLF